MKLPPVALAIVLLAAGVAFAGAEPLSKEQQAVLDREERQAVQMVSEAKKVLAQLDKKIPELTARMRSELASQQIADDSCPGPVTTNDTLVSSTKYNDCGELLKRESHCTSRKFDIDLFDKSLAARVAEFRAAGQKIDALAAKWAGERKQARDSLISDRARLGDLSQPVNAQLRRIQERENSFYQAIDSVVLWAVNLVWELQVDEAIGLRIRTGGYGGGRLPGLFDVVRSRAALNLVAVHRDTFVATCKEQIEDHKWALAGTGSEKEVNAAIDAANGVWMKCHEAESRERDIAAAPVRQMRDRLLEERRQLFSIVDAWRKVRTSSHFYVGEGAPAVDQVYAPDENAAQLKGIVTSYAPGDGGSGEKPQASILLPSLCRSSLHITRGDQPNPSTPVKYPDLETEPFNFEMDLQKPLVIDGVIAGASDQERP